MVSIKGLSKAQALAALYNASSPQGRGFMAFKAGDWTEADAEAKIATHPENLCFDYLHGRVMKVNLGKGDEFNEWGFDRDNGPGAAQRAIDSVRAASEAQGVAVTTTPEIQEAHKSGMVAAAKTVRDSIDEEGKVERHGSVEVVTMGYSDVSDVLAPAIDRAVGVPE